AAQALEGKPRNQRAGVARREPGQGGVELFWRASLGEAERRLERGVKAVAARARGYRVKFRTGPAGGDARRERLSCGAAAEPLLGPLAQGRASGVGQTCPGHGVDGKARPGHPCWVDPSLLVKLSRNMDNFTLPQHLFTTLGRPGGDWCGPR